MEKREDKRETEMFWVNEIESKRALMSVALIN